MNHQMTRRSLLRASPALLTPLAVAGPISAATADPVLPLYQAWCAARRDWLAASELPGNGNFEFPQSLDAERREHAALAAMVETTPNSWEGVAAIAHVLWSSEGPCAAPWAEDFTAQGEADTAKLIRSLWRAGTGRQDDLAVLTHGGAA